MPARPIEPISARLVFELIGAIALGAIVIIASTILVSPYWSLLGFAIYGWACLIFLRMETRGILLLLPLMITSLSAMISLVAIEFGGRIPELGTVGSAGSYTITYAMYEILFMLVYMAVFRAFHDKVAGAVRMDAQAFYIQFARLSVNFILFFAIMNILILLVNGLITGFPLLIGADRFVYRQRLGNGVVVYLLNLKATPAFLMGMAAFVLTPSPRMRRLFISLFVLLNLIWFLYGDKFFTILTAIAVFAGPWLYLNYRLVRRQITLFVLVCALAAVPASTITYLIYSGFGKLPTYEAMDKLNGRIVGQGQLWYIQSRAGAPMLTWNSDLVRRNIDILTEKEADVISLRTSIGPHYFSNMYAPDQMRASIYRNGGSTSYTMAMEPLGLVAFGWMGLAVLKAVLAVLTALCILYMVWAIASLSAYAAAASAFIFTQLTYLLRQGAPWVMFGVYSGRWPAGALVLELMLMALVVGSRSRPKLRPARRPVLRRWQA